MTDLEKRADEYSNNWRINKKANLNFAELVELRAVIYKAYKDGATKETALLSQHILDLQKDKGNLTDRVRELEQQIEKMKFNIKFTIKFILEDIVPYTVLNNILAKWGIKENE